MIGTTVYFIIFTGEQREPRCDWWWWRWW